MSPVVIGILAAVVIGLGVATWKAPRLTSVIVWSLVAAILASAALLLTLPGPFADVARWITLAVPLIWVGFQFWCYWHKKGWRVATGLIAVSLVSGLIIFVSEPMV